MSDHSFIGPSGASRWIACPLSAYLHRQMGEVRSGQAAIKGSVFHKGLELALTGEAEPWELIGERLEVGRDPNTRAIIRDEFTSDMADQVEELMAWVRENIHPEAGFAVERRLAAPHVHPEMFGTVDILAILDEHMWVVDGKNGRTEVEIGTEKAPNAQLALYAFMADLTDIKHVTLAVYQPNTPGPAFKVLELPAKAILNWVEREVIPALAEYDAIQETGSGEPREGPHCVWSPSKMLCPAMQSRMAKLKEIMMNPEYQFTDAELVYWLDWAPAIRHLLGQFEDEALARLSTGAELKSPELGKYQVGRSTRHRVWKPGAEKTLFEKYGKAIYSTTLKTPAALQKELGLDAVAEYAYQPEGAAKLVRPGERSAPKRTGASVFAKFQPKE